MLRNVLKLHRTSITIRLCGILPVLVILGACATPSSGVAASVQPAYEELQRMINLSIQLPAEYNLGGEIIVLPASERVALEASVSDEIPQRFKVSREKAVIYWNADSGTIFHDESRQIGEGLSNLWAPPAESSTSIITVTYEADYLSAQGQPFKIRKDTALRILSPSAPGQFKDGAVDGYTIGSYPDPYDTGIFQTLGVEESNFPRKYPDKYLPPEGFYKITRENVDLKISQHLDLRFFTMDFPWQSFGYPQYIALDLRLVRKLEDLHALLVENGIRNPTFKPIYGFRPPEYNLGTISSRSEINLKAPFSMHQYGRAIDLIVDQDGDDRIDDLNRDGVVDVFDAAELVKYVNLLDKRYRETNDDALGGAGIYDHHDFKERPVQSPYVHVDVRNYLSEGGGLVRWPANWPLGEGKTGPVIQWSKLYPGQDAKSLAVAGQ